MSDLYNVLCVFSLGDSKEHVDNLLNALEEISNQQCCSVRRKIDIIDVPEIPEQILSNS